MMMLLLLLMMMMTLIFIYLSSRHVHVRTVGSCTAKLGCAAQSCQCALYVRHRLFIFIVIHINIIFILIIITVILIIGAIVCVSMPAVSSSSRCFVLKADILSQPIAPLRVDTLQPPL
jgi:hypothetical protein